LFQIASITHPLRIHTQAKMATLTIKISPILFISSSRLKRPKTGAASTAKRFSRLSAQ